MATAKKNVRAARLKRADRKNISVGQAHIRSTLLMVSTSRVRSALRSV